MTKSLIDEQDAIALDESDELPSLRRQFRLPSDPSGRYDAAAYLAGNSLGLLPIETERRIAGELAAWAQLGVEGHVAAERPWVSYHELLREPAARLVGALPQEVVVMNSLTVNLHLMMASFYRPNSERYAIVIEDSAFPSDSYAVRSQVELHGLDPRTALIRLSPRPGEDTLRTDDVIAALHRDGHRIALVMLGGVNYYTGEYLDIPAITRAGKEIGAIVGWDLAHAAGNVALQLHEWGPDWAAWCSYKYLNAGPGATAGVFVHERHLANRALPKLSGWWSTDPTTRFLMRSELEVVDTADAWQLSNPSILAMAPVLASLEMFDAVGMPALRAKSERLTGYLADLLDELCAATSSEVITPRDPARRGAQLSLRVGDVPAGALSEQLRSRYGVFADAREPDVIRLAPAPMYCTFHDCWRAVDALRAVLAASIV